MGAQPDVHRELDHGFGAGQTHDAGRADALAPQRHEGGRLAERHAHLEAGGLTRLVAPTLRQDVDAVAIVGGEPELAAACHPDVGVGRRRVPARIGHGRFQHDVALDVGTAGAHEATHRVRDPAAELADTPHLGGVLVGVEAADHARARREDAAIVDVDPDRGARDRSAVLVDDRRLGGEVAALERPAVAAEAGQPGRRQDRDGRRDGLRLAVGIAELQLGQQLARRAGGGQQHHAPARGARGVEGEGLPRQRTHTVAGFVAVRITEHAGAHRPVGERERVESVGCGKTARSQLAAEHDRQAGRRPAGEVSDGQVGARLLARDQGTSGELHHAAHEGHAKLLHAHLSGRPLPGFPLRAAGGRGPHQHDVVPSQLGAARDVPRAVGAAVVAPGERLLVAFVTAEMADRERRRAVGGWHGGEAAHRLPADQVLHVRRLAGTEQRAVEHGVGDVRSVPRRRGQVEAEGLDALVPRRVHDAGVGARLGHHEEAAVEVAQRPHLPPVPERVGPFERAGGQRRLVGQRREARDAVDVGGAGGEHGTRAVGDRDPRAGDRRRRVERRHPHERRLLAPLQVHRQVRHQGRRGDVERTGRAGEGGAEARARQLDHVQSGLAERETDHFGDAVTGQWGQLDGLGAHGRGLASEHGARARCRRHPAEPAQRVGHGNTRDAAADAHSLSGRLGLQVAHRDRERRIGLRLDDAEAGGELRQRRLDVGAHRERKRRRVLEAASRLVVQVGRQLDAEVGGGGKGRPEHRLDGPALVRRRLRRPAPVVRTDQDDAARGLTRDRRRELHPHRAERGAAPRGILALAGQLRGERGTRRPAQRLR